MSPVSKARRADAQRNYEQLVAQAKIAFAESGVDASLDEIARRAGVASGTLYRHFPTRLDLVEVVLADQLAELVDLGRELLAADDPFAALETWLQAAVRHGLTYRGLSAAMLNSALDRDKDLMSAWHAKLYETGAALLAGAGDAVTDADAEDVLKMTGAIAWAAQDSAERADRLLSLLVNGLRR